MYRLIELLGYSVGSFSKFHAGGINTRTRGRNGAGNAKDNECFKSARTPALSGAVQTTRPDGTTNEE
jgi:hypothetical protein